MYSYSNFFLGYEFRKDGRYFVLAERRDGKDYLGVYDCDNSFKMMKVNFFVNYLLLFYKLFVNQLKCSIFRWIHSIWKIWHGHLTGDI